MSWDHAEKNVRARKKGERGATVCHSCNIGRMARIDLHKFSNGSCATTTVVCYAIEAILAGNEFHAQSLVAFGILLMRENDAS